MKKIIILFGGILLNNLLLAQTPSNILVTNPIAEDVLLGNYNPANYTPSIIINNADTIIAGIKSEVSADSLHSLLKKLGTFHNRNVYSDTISDSIGIGAARRWVYSYFQKVSADNENRLIPSYLQYDLGALPFDPVNCFAGQFRNTFAVLPGMDTTNPSIVIFSAHMDSRCVALCGDTCKAHGIEDNGSGTALVMELARVMSKYSYNSTLVFLLTVAEEQGLFGATAFAIYAQSNSLPIKAVQNNDVIGGIICGNTASPPTNCTQMGQIDSMQVRIFSIGNLNLTHRGYARYIKLIYLEKLISIVDVPMTINIMNQEDRTGRGGDHQAFRQRGFTAIRFTAQHEHGNGSGTPPDRTHTPNDILGVDTTGDGIIDSFFVDFNYLKRNAVINGVSATMTALGPEIPDFILNNDSSGLSVQITTQTQYLHYRIGVRTLFTDFDAVYSIKDTTSCIIPNISAGISYKVSVASVDSNGIMSPFSKELFKIAVVNTDSFTIDSIINPINCDIISGTENFSSINLAYKELLQCIPNPFSKTTTIIIKAKELFNYHPDGRMGKSAFILITDIVGKEIKRIKVNLNDQENKIIYNPEVFVPGIYNYSLVVDGINLVTQQMVIVE